MQAWREHEEGRLAEPEFNRVLEDAIRAAVKMQEDIGLEVITDGEFRRGGWSRGFLSAVEGFTFKASYLTFHNDQGISTPAPAPVATKKLRRTRGIVTEDFAFLKGTTKRTPKVTMPTPSHMHFGHFGEAMDKSLYREPSEYWNDLVGIYQEEIAALGAMGCRFLQLDEVPLTLCCDETNRGVAKRQGEDPEKLIDTYIDVINRAIAKKPKDMRVVLHMCRGNMQGLWMGDGGYAPIAERLFGRLNVDGYLLEYDSPRAGDFAPLKYLRKGTRAFLGLISTKRPAVESLDELKRRIDEAARHVPLEQLGLTPQCGFGSSAMSKFNVLPNPMNEDLQRRKLERMVEAGRRIWS
ncbi:MAG TPA: 5-methyltetrahydropteroyltriglutamate--homocysteine S-methyltransferase [Burkholderiales bacterium]|nr:5-methyltetrahydropteroyltriglutamate--homocysteine S-methyltransferase [Burkholderiales bacterium]